MRLSTAGMHRHSIDAILDQQFKLAKTQEQISTGRKFNTASEDPIGATRAAAFDRTLADLTQFGRNSDIIENRLNYEEQTLAELTLVLQRARELGLQGANSTVGPDERRMIANEIRQNLQALLELANRDDGNGEFLFSGTSTATRPFAQGPAGVSYQGDDTVRQIRVSNTQSLADGHSGVDVFMNIAERNGTFRTSIGAANTGGGSVTVGSVTDLSAWVPGNYTLQFTTTTDWQVVDDATPTPNVVATGAGFTPGQTISFNGISFAVNGQPDANDTFDIQPAQRLDVFAMVEDLASALTLPTALPGDAAVSANRIGAAIANMDRALERTVSVRSEVGTRLNAVDQAKGLRESEAIDLQSLLSDLRDTDYAQAISQLNQQYAGLQAAQAAYTRVSQMSLFDFL